MLAMWSAWILMGAWVAAPAPEIVRTLDVPYGDRPVRLRSLDLYAPSGAKNLPIMVYIHGGGWRAGDKRAVAEKPEFSIRQGFLFVSLNYRLVPAVDIRTQLQDSADGIGWLKKNVAQYGGDPAQIHLVGHSAGAHHVAVLASQPSFLQKAGVELAQLKSAVVLDTQALDVPTLMQGNSNPIYQQAFGTDPAIWKQISPRHGLQQGQMHPPFLIVVADGRGPKLKQAEAFAEAVRKFGGRAEILEAPEHTHASLNRSLGAPRDKVTQAVARFLAAVRGESPRSGKGDSRAPAGV